MVAANRRGIDEGVCINFMAMCCTNKTRWREHGMCLQNKATGRKSPKKVKRIGEVEGETIKKGLQPSKDADLQYAFRSKSDLYTPPLMKCTQ